jgi:DegV family protein with EDD domain
MVDVRIVTDVTAHLAPELIAKHRIVVLPVEVRIGDETFLIKPGDSQRKLFERMAEGPAKPTEASISPIAFEEAYGRLNRETEDILVISSSSKLSDGYSVAHRAARTFMGRCHITVLDSMSTSWGLGLVVEAAAAAAAQGRPLDDIVRLVRGLLPHLYFVFFVERLDYLEQQGRIGVAQALLGTILRIKPLLLVEGGDIIPMEKVRTRIRALEKLADFVAEFASVQDIVILRSPLEDSAEELVEDLSLQLLEALPDQQFPAIAYDPVLACHLGPEAFGLVVFEGI